VGVLKNNNNKVKARCNSLDVPVLSRGKEETIPSGKQKFVKFIISSTAIFTKHDFSVS